MQKFIALGVMSGTSLDGVDIVLSEFTMNKGKWTFVIEKGHTYPYSDEWRNILKSVHFNLPAFELLKLDQEYGIFLGNLINEFLFDLEIKPQIIASHGHTVFHQPCKGITCQIGNGNNIAAQTGLPVACDFRSKDVALGGQGAPLVPYGDMYLFPEYKYCINFGGFANISIKERDRIKAFDICPVNIIINHLVADVGLEFDIDGKLGKKGKVNTDFLNRINDIEFYNVKGPKSLGKEWLEEYFLPLTYLYNIPLEDKIRTIYEHIVQQVENVLNNDFEKLLLTGGGALNQFLVSLLSEKLNQEIIIPSNDIICFKEALVFSFLGVLRIMGKTNILCSVTGASKDNIGGALFA